MTIPRFRSVHMLGEHPMLFGAVVDQIDEAKARGEFPGRHGTATSDDTCLFFGDATNPVAFLTLHDTDRALTWWLDVVLVQPSHRRQGLGARLVRSAIRLARMNSCDLRCGITDDNVASRALFAAAGFMPHHTIYALPVRAPEVRAIRPAPEFTPCK